MTTTTSLLRPGLLVSLKTSVRGGVRYQTIDLETGREVESGAAVSRWETTRVIADPAEYERAVKTRGAARTVIGRACYATAFGLMCPTSKAGELAEAVAEARKLADEFNLGASTCRLEVYVITGQIASDDAEAAKAISSEVRDLLAAMEASVKAADPAAIRDAASRARQVAGMLSPDASALVGKAIEQVRRAAREIVRRVEKAGETAAEVVSQLKLDALEQARFAVLDFKPEGDADEAEYTALEVAPAPALDLIPVAEVIEGEAADAPALLPSMTTTAYEFDAAPAAQQ